MKGIPPSLTLLLSTGQSADSLAWHKMSFTIWLCPGFSDLLCPFANLSLVAQMVKNLLAVQETWVRSLGWEDPLEKGTVTHSSILAWRIPWTDRGIAESEMTEPTNTLCFYSASQPNPVIHFPLCLSCISKPICSEPPVWQTLTYTEMSLSCPSVTILALCTAPSYTANTLHCNGCFHIFTHYE